MCLQSIVAKPGQPVKKGDLVAYVGAYNGRNAHLHLALKEGNPCDVLTKCSPADSRACK
jgi:murein DD-endopeptidase MepM/ murein hydrolase activator NlpD